MSKPATMSNFHGAHNVTTGDITNINANNFYHNGGRSRNAVKELQEHMAAGAMPDSAERCDAPKCHPETRVAVQNELIGWIEHGDEEEEPNRIIWVTGPAGGGKTAIMGSIADTCQRMGLLACGFFFSSFTGSTNRRFKRCLVVTLAYQLVQHPALRDVGERILSCVEQDPAIFERQLEVQLDRLLVQPLRELRRDAQLPKIILIDGLDECQAENDNDLARPARSPQEMARRNEADQKEILQVLLKAVNDPTFPFRIIIASRPEAVIQSFFTDTAHHITKRIFLDNKYNPDADMMLFLEARFAEIRREYKLSSSWPSQDVKEALVGNASGQFIYVATVMRFISSDSPHEQLEQVMTLRRSDASANPFAPLDALYTHILSSSAKPLLAVRWLSLIFCTGMLDDGLSGKQYPVQFVQPFLEASPGEASHVFKGLNSLIFVPPTDDHTSPYSLFHKSFTDFLRDRSRCGSLYVDNPTDLFSTRYLQIWKDKGPATPLDPLKKEEFLHWFMERFGPLTYWSPLFTGLEQDFDSYDVGWWVRSQDVFSKQRMCGDPSQHTCNVDYLFCIIHTNCVWYQRCRPACRYIRMELIKELKKLGWKTPGSLRLLGHRFRHYDVTDDTGISQPITHHRNGDDSGVNSEGKP
ncbi:hypothetical protein MD484_g4157, partial [Candolleomyces efflorescens]